MLALGGALGGASVSQRGMTTAAMAPAAAAAIKGQTERRCGGDAYSASWAATVTWLGAMTWRFWLKAASSDLSASTFTRRVRPAAMRAIWRAAAGLNTAGPR